MYLKKIEVPGLAHYSYMIGSEGECAVIDPKRDVDEYLELAEFNGLRITHIFETHVHADFVSGARELAYHTGAGIYAGALGELEFDHVPLKDGDQIKVGKIEIKALHTPGHTPEHICYLVHEEGNSGQPPILFSGDTLFTGEVGRPDLLGEETTEILARQLFQSLSQKLARLDDHVQLLPGHGAGSLCGRHIANVASSTIGNERLTNYAFQIKDEDEFVKLVTKDLPPAPPYFKRMKKINKQGPQILKQLPLLNILNPRDLVGKLDEYQLIDVRYSQYFGRGHLKNSYNIYVDASFSTWVGWLISPDKPIILIIDDYNVLDEAVRQLVRVGYENLAGFIQADITLWQKLGLPIETLENITVADLKALMKQKEDLLILDVRERNEWASGRIPGAINIPLGFLNERLELLDPNRTTILVCASGFRSSAAASILQQQGFKNIANVIGGTNAWASSKYELEK